jgi:hypothetical protein
MGKNSRPSIVILIPHQNHKALSPIFFPTCPGRNDKIKEFIV